MAHSETTTKDQDNLVGSALVELDSYLKGISRKRLVVTFVNKSYLEIFDRWLSCFKNSYNQELFVVALDNEAFKKLKDLGVESILIELKSFKTFLSTKEFHATERRQLSLLWKVRWTVFQRVISHGVELVHSDADALWLRNPLPALPSSEFDLIASIGRSWPTDIANIWGFVLCMGFFVLRPTEASKNFVNLVLEEIRNVEADDQVTANTILFNHGAIWSNRRNGTLETYIENLNFRVSTIEDGVVSRQDQGQPLVYHPYLKGDIRRKIQILDRGVHEVRAREGLDLSYYRRPPILKMQETTNSANEKLVFIHIPKAGGTSVQEMFSLTGRGHIRAADATKQKNSYTISVCRNPYSRLVSAFHYLTDRARLPRHDHEESKYVDEYRNDFRGFVENLVGSMDIYRSIHLIPQSFFVFAETEIAVDEIIPLERLQEQIQPLIERFGGTSKMRHRNRSEHNDVDTYYDDRVRSIVARTYSLDFALLGYDPLQDANSGPVQTLRSRNRQPC